MKFAIIIGLCLIGFSIQQTPSASVNTPFPTCTPKTTHSTYEDTLIVFVFNYEGSSSLVEARSYLFKQFACEIPIVNNIKTHLLYFGQNETTPFTDADFVDSGKIVEKLANPFTVIGRLDSCKRLEKHLAAHKDNAHVKKYKNVHYIILTELSKLCPGLDAKLNKWFLFYKDENRHYSLSMLDDYGNFININTSAATSQPLETFANEIVSEIFDSQTTTSSSSSSESDEESDGIPIEIWILWGISALLLVAIIAVWVYHYYDMKKINHDNKIAEEQEKAEAEAEAKAKAKEKENASKPANPPPKPISKPKKAEKSGTLKSAESVLTDNTNTQQNSYVTESQANLSTTTTQKKTRKYDFDDDAC